MKNTDIVADAFIIGIGTFLLGMVKPALVILGVVAVFLFSIWFIPRLGQWFVSAGISVCGGIVALFILSGVAILNALLVGTFLGSVVLIVMGNMLIRRQRLYSGSFRGEMAELPEVAEEK